MNKKTFITKSNGDTLEASEWNELTDYINEAVDAINTEGSGDSVVSTEVDPLDANKTFVKVGSVTVAELTSKGEKGTNVGLSGNNNINIEPRPAAGDGSGKNTPGLANRKGGNIALKPGDDIEFWGHKRGSSKSDEVSVKIMTEVPKESDPTKTDEVAAKLQLNAGDIVLTSKDKLTQSDEMNITVNKAADTRGYLKVRAQAIDLRSESHGGIALQPKGSDEDGNINKIKFEHGGGDGLEFGTFNTEKTSIFTDEYRFKKDGIWKMATRNTVASDKADSNDTTTAYKYVKQADDFYDIIDSKDREATTELIINAAYVLSGKYNKNATKFTYVGTSSSPDADNTYEFPENNNLYVSGVVSNFSVGLLYTALQIITALGLNSSSFEDFISQLTSTGETISVAEYEYHDDTQQYTFYLYFNFTSNVDVPMIISGSIECPIHDVIKLVNYMKSNHEGPWQTSNSNS